MGGVPGARPAAGGRRHTRPGTTWDALHRRAWELLRDDPALLEDYAEAKQTPEGKHEFFERVVRLLYRPGSTARSRSRLAPATASWLS